MSDRALALVACAGLAVLLLLLPFHLFFKRTLPEPIGTYWKDLVLAGLVLLLLVWALRRRRTGLRRTLASLDPITAAVVIFAGLLIARTVTSPDWGLALWGLYLGAAFLPIYFLVVAVLPAADRAPDGSAAGSGDGSPRQSPFSVTAIHRLLIGLVVVGCLVSLGGAVEFLADRTLVPSEEIFERSGFYAVYVFGTNIRRAYFTFDAPTALGHYLTLILPIGAALLIAPPTFGKRAKASDRAAGARAIADGAKAPGAEAADLTADDRPAEARASAPGAGLWSPRLVRLVLAAGLVVVAFALGVTFSRAAWVGALAGLAWLILSGWLARDRRWVAAGLAGLAIFALGWGAASLVASQRGDRHRQTIEVPARLLTRVPSEAPSAQPALLDDPPSSHWTIGGETRAVWLSEPPPAGTGELTYHWDSFPAQSLVFGVALDPRFWTPDYGDGVRLSALAESAGSSQVVFSRHLNPKRNPADRKWRTFEMDLSAYQGDPLTLRFRVDPENSPDYDLIGWSEPRLLATPLFADLRSGSTAIAADQVESIGDWSEDSNLDRLEAWRRSFEMWQERPIWGWGIGQTGAATFRGSGGAGFVTESQFLKVIVEMGLIGLFAFLGIVAAAGWAIWRLLRWPAPLDQRVSLFGVTAALAALFVDGLVLQNLEIKQVQLVFWFLLGTLAVYYRLRVAAAERPVPSPDFSSADGKARRSELDARSAQPQADKWEPAIRNSEPATRGPRSGQR